MIRSFRDRDTRKLFENERVPRFAFIERAAKRKMFAVHTATRLEDLRLPSGNRLEALKGDRQG